MRQMVEGGGRMWMEAGMRQICSRRWRYRQGEADAEGGGRGRVTQKVECGGRQGEANSRNMDGEAKKRG